MIPIRSFTLFGGVGFLSPSLSLSLKGLGRYCFCGVFLCLSLLANREGIKTYRAKITFDRECVCTEMSGIVCVSVCSLYCGGGHPRECNRECSFFSISIRIFVCFFYCWSHTHDAMITIDSDACFFFFSSVWEMKRKKVQYKFSTCVICLQQEVRCSSSFVLRDSISTSWRSFVMKRCQFSDSSSASSSPFFARSFRCCVLFYNLDASCGRSIKRALTRELYGAGKDANNTRISRHEKKAKL